MRRAPAPRSSLLLLLAMVLAAPTEAWSQASPRVPPLDPAYDELEALVSAGWVEGLILGQGPLTRLGFARAAAQARGRMTAADAPPKARAREALLRLEAAFAAEAALLACAPAPHTPSGSGSEACPGGPPALALRDATLGIAAADASVREIPTRYLPVVNPDGENLDADLRPFLERAQGRVLDPAGWTLASEASVEAVFGHRVAGALRPRSWALRGDDGLDVDASLLEGYLRTVLGNASLELGRIWTPLGPARTYGPVLSHNARALDQLRLSTDRPIRLPWIFGALGPTHLGLWVAHMGSDRDIPGSKLIGLKGAIRPHPRLELGGTLLNLQFGQGAPPATWGQRLRDFLFMERRRFLPFDDQGEFSDKVMAADARLDLPEWGTRLYLGVMTTDDHNLFRSPRDGLVNNATWTAGARVAGLGEEGRVDLWMEGTYAGVRAYTHHQFTSGMALDRRVLGSPVGPLGAGVQAGIVWNGPRHRVEVVGAAERHAGDLYDMTPNMRFERVEDLPDEVRRRLTLEWTRGGDGLLGLRTHVALGWERVTRFAFGDEDRSNVLLQVGAGYRWR